MIFNAKPVKPSKPSKHSNPSTLLTPVEKSAHNFGDFDAVIRELAEHDPSKFKWALSLPIRDGLLLLEHRMKMEAVEAFKHQQLLWALLAPHCKNSEPPEVPEILKF